MSSIGFALIIESSFIDISLVASIRLRLEFIIISLGAFT